MVSVRVKVRVLVYTNYQHRIPKESSGLLRLLIELRLEQKAKSTLEIKRIKDPFIMIFNRLQIGEKALILMYHIPQSVYLFFSACM